MGWGLGRLRHAGQHALEAVHTRAAQQRMAQHRRARAPRGGPEGDAVRWDGCVSEGRRWCGSLARKRRQGTRVRVPGVGEARESATTPASAPPIPPPPHPTPSQKCLAAPRSRAATPRGTAGPCPRERAAAWAAVARGERRGRGESIRRQRRLRRRQRRLAPTPTRAGRAVRHFSFVCLAAAPKTLAQPTRACCAGARRARARRSPTASHPSPTPFTLPPRRERTCIAAMAGIPSLAARAHSGARGRERARPTGPAARMRFGLRVRHPGIAQPHPSNPSVNAHSSLFTQTIPGHRRPLAPARPLAARARSVSATSRARPPPRFFVFFFRGGFPPNELLRLFCPFFFFLVYVLPPFRSSAATRRDAIFGNPHSLHVGTVPQM